jgi:hypothetical protein
MSKVEEYVATRIEHVKRQFADGDGHGQYADGRAIKRRLETLWAALTEPERREAEKRYFAETWPMLSTRRS